MLIIKNAAGRVFHRVSPPRCHFFAKQLILSTYSLPPIFPETEKLGELNPKAIASSFKDWFKCRTESSSSLNRDLDRVCQALNSQEDTESSLSELGLRLTEELVVKVLKLQRDVLPCLKFFDWAGRQPGYGHTRATYHAIFKILSKAKLMSVMLDWLEKFTNQRNVYSIRFYDTLVMGYAVAGKPDMALQLFGKMRFQGLDLNDFAYNVLLNALVEERAFDAADVISKQIDMRGFDSPITYCIRIKSFCKQNRFDEAKAYLRKLERDGSSANDHMLVILVDALCKQKKFEEARQLMEEFGSLGKIPMSNTYNTWLNDLVQAGRVNGAMEFFQDNRPEGYKPNVPSYNALICGLLRENRLEEVYDLFIEMKEKQFSPDKHTMNATLCFFCKAGMVDVAIELYNDRLEIGLSPSNLAYNHLINALCYDGNLDDAYRIFDDCVKQGCFPSNQTFNLLASVLCKSGKLDKMSMLVDLALQRKIIPSNAVCVRYISALCKAGRVEEGFLIPEMLNKMGNILNCYTYSHLIRGFSEIRRGDMASRLLLEMQENGHTPTRSLYRSVICCLCGMGNPDQVLKLLDIQVSQHSSNPRIYNFFINGAGHAGQPDLAMKVYERMVISGCKPNFDTSILMLQSYLKNKQIVDALNFFSDKCQEPTIKLYNVMIAGLSNAHRTELALMILREAREKGLAPSLQCYEELICSLCSSGKYEMVLKVLGDLEKTGRRVSRYIYNQILLHTLKSPELHRAWALQGNESEEASWSGTMVLRQLVATFSGGTRAQHHLGNVEELVEQFFQVDINTYNILLRGLCREGRVDYAYGLFSRICEKGYAPNKWTYDILVNGFCNMGRKKDAERLMDEMVQLGFNPTWWTFDLYKNLASKGS